MLRNFILAACISAASFSASADNIMVSTFSYHTESSYQGEEYNNINPGIGYEKVLDDVENYVAGVYLIHNSFHNNALALSINRKILDMNGVQASVGLLASSGYEAFNKFLGGYLITPISAVQYKNVRLSTSLPFGSMAGISDFINLSFVFKI